MADIALNICSPLLTVKRYAELVGISVDAVNGKIKRGQLPVIKQGSSRFINVALLTKQALEAE